MCDAPGRGSVTTSMIKIIIEAFAAAGRPRGLHVFLARIERLGTAGEDFCCWGRCNILLHMASQQGQPPTEKLLVPARIIGRCHHTSPPGGCKESVQRDSSRGCGVALMLLKPLNPGNPQTLLLLLSTLLSEWPMHCKQFGGLTTDSTVASIPIVPRNVWHAAWNWGRTAPQLRLQDVGSPAMQGWAGSSQHAAVT